MTIKKETKVIRKSRKIQTNSLKTDQEQFTQTLKRKTESLVKNQTKTNSAQGKAWEQKNFRCQNQRRKQASKTTVKT